MSFVDIKNCLDEAASISVSNDDFTAINWLWNSIQNCKNSEAIDDILNQYADSLNVAFEKNVLPNDSTSFDYCQELVSFSLNAKNANMLEEAIHAFEDLTCKENANLILRHNDFHLHVNATYLQQKLLDMIEQMFANPNHFELAENKPSIDLCVSMCYWSKICFQLFARVIAERMIKYNFPDNLQRILEYVVDSIRSTTNNDEFAAMYEDELTNYVIICCEDEISESGSDCECELVESLHHLRQINYEHFVIICTHFPKYLRLLKTP